MKGITLAILIALVGCGPSERDKALSATLVSTNAAAEAFVQWDAHIQHEIVQGATSREEAEAQLLQWREKRIKAQGVLVDAYRAIAIAATLDDGLSLQNALSAFAILRQTLTSMGVTL